MAGRHTRDGCEAIPLTGSRSSRPDNPEETDQYASTGRPTAALLSNARQYEDTRHVGKGQMPTAPKALKSARR